MKTIQSMTPLEKALEIVNIPELWEILGLPGFPLLGRNTLSPFRVETTPSFNISSDGRLFNDFGYPSHKGNAVHFLMIACGCSKGDAAKELIRLASNIKTDHSKSILTPASLETCPRQTEPFIPRPMPPTIQATWDAGLSLLRRNSELQIEIAEQRGWPVEVTNFLNDCGLMGYPECWSKFGPAFRVDFPVLTHEGKFAVIPIGFHVRLQFDVTKKPPWFVFPNRRFGNYSVPLMPFVLGTFSQAKLLVITEGQWDAITFAHTAGWLSPNGSFPNNVCVIGIRGVQGTKPFLNYYRQFWPEGVKTLLIPDNDPAGDHWTHGQASFEHELRCLCCEVRVLKVRKSEGKDFNAAHKLKPFFPSDISTLLRIYGMLD